MMCSMAGKSDMSSEEALQCELNVHNVLTFPSTLQLPALYLMKYMNESKFGAIVEMIYAFVSKRYFIGEQIDANINGKKIGGRIVKVIPPSVSDIRDKVSKNSGDNENKSIWNISFGIDPTLYKYEVLLSGESLVIIDSDMIKRGKGLLTKDKMRNFLKQHVSSPKRFQKMTINASSKDIYDIDNTKWSHIFSGPEPTFKAESVIKKFNKNKKMMRETKITDYFQKDSNNLSPSKSKNVVSSNNSASKIKIDKLKKKNIVANKKNSKIIQSNNNKNTAKKFQINQKLSKNAISSKERKRQELKQQKLEQKIREKEFKKQFEEEMKEWSAKRDDLACDDLISLPNPTPIKCDIPIELFGDSLVVMEFLHCFYDLFDLKGIFPFGITFELMERILNESDIHGPFGDVIRIMLTSIFTLQEEEEKINLSNRDESSDDEAYNEEEKPTYDNEISADNEFKFAVKNANNYANWFSHNLGLTCSQITLDSFNITEVLRIHLLSSGSASKLRSKFRSCQSREDPGLWFVIENPQILTKLEFDNIFELTCEERLKLLQVLINQVLAFVTFRDYIDNSFEEISKLKRKLRDIQTSFSKWNKEKASKRNNIKKEINLESHGINGNTESGKTSYSIEHALTEQIDYKRERMRKVDELNKNSSEIRAQLAKFQACYNLKPIGFDRAYRRYWVFESIAGIFVERLIPDTAYTELPFGPCLPEPTPIESNRPIFNEKISVQQKEYNKNIIRDDSSTTSDKENEMKSLSPDTAVANECENLRTDYLLNDANFDRCSADVNTCCVHGLVNYGQRINWGFYHTIEQLESLMFSLNNRGFRESELLLALTQDKNYFSDKINKCHAYKLNKDISCPEVRKSVRLQESLHLKAEKSNYSHLKPSVALETALRDLLVTTEDRIFSFGLGVSGGVSRNEWRASVERSLENKLEMIEKFSEAILALAHSIRSQCLSQPLTTENGVFDRWVESLKQCKSFSQLFVHLRTLDQSVMWSKSVLKAYCKLCCRKCDAENMLLCDACNRGHHTYCLKPPLSFIPRGEWYCSNCKPKFKPLSPKKRNNNNKFFSEHNEEDDDSNYDVESDSDDYVSLSSLKNDKQTTSALTSRSASPLSGLNVCFNCNKLDATMDGLWCSTCNSYFHLICQKLKRMPRNNWCCDICSKVERSKRKLANYTESDSYEDSETESKVPKKSRYSQDYDYLNGEMIFDETNLKQTENNSKRRLMIKASKVNNSRDFLDFGMCEDILKKLQKHDDGWLFRNKPMPKFAPNYHKIIKKYVDFGQLVTRLNMGHYRTNFHFFNDILLMFANCQFYWPTDTLEYASGISLANYFYELLNEYDINPFS